jgi:hypothetical protein
MENTTSKKPRGGCKRGDYEGSVVSDHRPTLAAVNPYADHPCIDRGLPVVDGIADGDAENAMIKPELVAPMQ